MGYARWLPSGAVAALTATALLVPSASSASADPIAGDRITVAVSQLDSMVTGLMNRSGVPGAAVAVVHGDQVLYAKGFGVRDVSTGAPVTAETVFQLASVSKPIGASVVAAAIGRGTLSWNDPVQRYLPWFALDDPYVTAHVTVADMYAMRSGLPDAAGDLLELIGYDRAQVLHRLRFVPLEPFRITYAYSDFSLTAGAQAAAVASGTSWARLSQELLYTPLGMTSTSSTYEGFLAQPNRAALHVPDASGWKDRYVRDADAQSPAGGVSSNVVDLAAWLRMELAGGMFEGKQVVAAEPLAEANTAQIRRTPVTDPAVSPGFYGYGMNVDELSSGSMMLSHSGAFTAGGGTNVTLLPGSDLGIVVLTNAHAGLAEAIAATFVDLAQSGTVSRDWWSLYSEVFSAPYQPDPAFAEAARPGQPTPSRRHADLVGRYANDFYGTAVVVQRAGRLALVLGPDHVALPLEHWSGDRFTATIAIENAPLHVWVDFAGAGRQATTVNLGLSDDATSMLTRVP
jgi:CubicO group peptidase (beta-lactamase class C family)